MPALLVPGLGLVALLDAVVADSVAVDEADESLEVPGTADIIAANQRVGSRLRGWREAVPMCRQFVVYLN